MSKRWGILTFLLRLVGTILALAAVINVNNAHLRVTEIREELLTAIQGLRNERSSDPFHAERSGAQRFGEYADGHESFSV